MDLQYDVIVGRHVDEETFDITSIMFHKISTLISYSSGNSRPQNQFIRSKNHGKNCSFFPYFFE